MRYRAGDLVTRGENTGVVRELRGRRVDDRPFLKVEIVSGPRAPGWDWPEGWRPQLDVGDQPTYLQSCGECHRDFKATKPFEILCRTCDADGLQERAGQERAGASGDRRGLLEHVRRYGE